MTAVSANKATPDRLTQTFRKSLPARVKLGEIVRAVETNDEQNCLTVAASELLLTYHLHQRAGKWQALAYGEGSAERFATLLGANVKPAKEHKMPFKDKTFDVVIVLDIMERIDHVEALIIECHRVLKPSGLLVVTVPNVKPWSLIRPLQSMLGLTDQRRGWVRPGYTETELFRVLKDGFDVHRMHSYSRFFVELINTIRLLTSSKSALREEEGNDAALRRNTALYPFFWIAYQIDALFFFARGAYLIATAKRRAWLPRKTPVLSDGRSITEAVLSRIDH